MARNLSNLKVIEIFPSLQGEGVMIGCRMIFIRLAGCNLKCPWCDTKYSWKSGEEKSIEEIVREVHKYAEQTKAQWVCLTGGEPLIQYCRHLVERLISLGFFITVETNGTVCPDYINLFDFVSISPKKPASIETITELIELSQNCQIKFVYARGQSLEWIRDTIIRLSPQIPIVIQPDGMCSLSEYLDQLRFLWTTIQRPRWKEYDIRIIPQLHVLLYGHEVRK